MNTDPDLPSRKLVGVYGNPVLNARKSFKQEALLFDQIVIPELDEHLSRRAEHRELAALIPNFHDLFYLRDIGILKSVHVHGIESLSKVRAFVFEHDGTFRPAMRIVERERNTDVAALFNVCDKDLGDTGRYVGSSMLRRQRAGVLA